MSDDDRRPGTDPVTSYEIRVKGVLAPRWSAWLEELTIDTDGGDGITALRGPIVDQAALHGLLQKLRDVGIPIVSLTEIPNEPISHANEET